MKFIRCKGAEARKGAETNNGKSGTRNLFPELLLYVYYILDRYFFSRSVYFIFDVIYLFPGTESKLRHCVVTLPGPVTRDLAF